MTDIVVQACANHYGTGLLHTDGHFRHLGELAPEPVRPFGGGLRNGTFMTPQNRERFPAFQAVLANGVRALIRPLHTGDARILGDFYLSVPAQDYRFYRNRPLTREQAATMAASADHPHRVVLVLVPTPRRGSRQTDDSIGGYAWYRWEDGTEPGVLGICIGPRFQNLGAGTALMKRLLEIARTVGPAVISLTVQKANPRAVRLYRKMGFRIVREQTRPASHWFPAEPEYYMERPSR